MTTSQAPVVYYQLSLLVAVPEEKTKEWDSSCDETFHGPAGLFHNPDNGVWVTGYNRSTEAKADDLKYKLFTPEGGI